MRPERLAPKLSPREEQLLEFAADGLTDTAIAHELGISEATVGTYWGRVRIKLGPYSRTELVALKMRRENELTLQNLRAENEALVAKLRGEQMAAGGTSYKELLAYAPDAMLMISGQGLIEYANKAALDLFGYQESELIGQELLCLVPHRFRAQHLNHRNAYMLHPDRRQMGEHLETPALHRDGSEFSIRAALAAITTAEHTSVICTIR
jgi:PAS domain S-box-containing protein